MKLKPVLKLARGWQKFGDNKAEVAAMVARFLKNPRTLGSVCRKCGLRYGRHVDFDCPVGATVKKEVPHVG